jgi:hypothetical protein
VVTAETVWDSAEKMQKSRVEHFKNSIEFDSLGGDLMGYGMGGIILLCWLLHDVMRWICDATTVVESRSCSSKSNGQLTSLIWRI